MKNPKKFKGYLEQRVAFNKKWMKYHDKDANYVSHEEWRIKFEEARSILGVYNNYKQTKKRFHGQEVSIECEEV